MLVSVELLLVEDFNITFGDDGDEEVEKHYASNDDIDKPSSPNDQYHYVSHI